jgi:hypothetical protein
MVSPRARPVRILHQQTQDERSQTVRAWRALREVPVDDKFSGVGSPRDAEFAREEYIDAKLRFSRQLLFNDPGEGALNFSLALRPGDFFAVPFRDVKAVDGGTLFRAILAREMSTPRSVRVRDTVWSRPG